MLEQTVLMREKVMKAGDGGSIKDNDTINDMIFESIKAKLSVLEDINA